MNELQTMDNAARATSIQAQPQPHMTSAAARSSLLDSLGGSSRRRHRRAPLARRAIARRNARTRVKAVLRQGRSAHTPTFEYPAALAA